MNQKKNKLNKIYTNKLQIYFNFLSYLFKS